MVKHADDSPEAELLQKQQARRLMHFRRVLGLTRTTAAEMAGISRFSWRRMEEGLGRIDTVPLRRFLAAYERHPNLPAEYIISGSTAGLPPLLAMNLLQLDRDEPEDFGGSSGPPSGGSGGQQANGILGRPQRRSKASNGRRSGPVGLMAA